MKAMTIASSQYQAKNKFDSDNKQIEWEMNWEPFKECLATDYVFIPSKSKSQLLMIVPWQLLLKS